MSKDNKEGVYYHQMMNNNNNNNKCTVCHNNAKEKFLFKGKTIILCWSCNHKVRETIAGINDKNPDMICQDIIIQTIATDFYESHKKEIRAAIACDTL